MKYLLLIILILLYPNLAQSQTPEAVTIARMCISEAGWEPGPDCDALFEVLLWRAERRNMPVANMARAYGKSAFDRTRTDSRAWVVFLNRAMTEPKFWPSNLHWDRYQTKWEAMIAYTQSLLDGTRKAQYCPAEHWGARGRNATRARLRGWIRVDCGDTQNVFWRE